MARQNHRRLELGELADRRVLLASVMFSQSSSPSVHVRLLGELQDPRARDAVAAVTQARVKRLAATYRELGFDRQRAEVRARLAYAAHVGLLQMAQETPDRVMRKAQISALMAELRATLLAAPRARCLLRKTDAHPTVLFRARTTLHDTPT